MGSLKNCCYSRRILKNFRLEINFDYDFVHLTTLLQKTTRRSTRHEEWARLKSSIGSNRGCLC